MLPSKNNFQKSTMWYQKFLKISGYKNKVQYQQLREGNQHKNTRKRIIILFNQSYSKFIKMNIKEIFIKLIIKNVLSKQKIVKVFKKITIKLSYFRMENIRSNVNGHNEKLQQLKPTEPQKLCHYLVKEDYPMKGTFFTSSIFYQATIKCIDSKHKQK